MHDRADLARGMLAKAESDLRAAALMAESGVALDAACFHAQQAVEKLLKAFLLAQGAEAPRTHNLVRLLLLCQQHDPTFAQLAEVGDALTPYAVELRYETTFWPESDEAQQAVSNAQRMHQFVLARLPLAGRETD